MAWILCYILYIIDAHKSISEMTANHKVFVFLYEFYECILVRGMCVLRTLLLTIKSVLYAAQLEKHRQTPTGTEGDLAYADLGPVKG